MIPHHGCNGEVTQPSLRFFLTCYLVIFLNLFIFETFLIRDALSKIQVHIKLKAKCLVFQTPCFIVFVDCALQEADLEPSSIVLTEYSTFTYYLTSLIAGETVTKTDIIVSSNVVTQTQPPEATPSLEPAPSPRPTITGMGSLVKLF